MQQFFVWLVRIFIGLCIVVSGGVLGLYFLLSQSLPNYNKTLPVNGISNPVEIIRNTANVPHIFGETDADVMFGMGYAHAQDRLWQMTLLRRTAQGKLSEVFGSATVDDDIIMRSFEFYDRANKSLLAFDSKTVKLLQAYADGVNARLFEINDQSLGRGAPEFFIFSNEIAPWHPADSVVIYKLLAFMAANNAESEVLRTLLSVYLTPERAADLLPTSPGHGIVDLPDYLAQASAPPLDDMPSFTGRKFAGASNVWAAGPSRSTAGGALLANDPHSVFTAPALWYLARLDLQSGSVIGGSIPGMPAILVGRSHHMGWGLTNAYLDDQDIYIEQVNPENPNQYRSLNGFIDFETRPKTIFVRNADPIKIDVRSTVNGVVVPDGYANIGAVTPKGHVASLSWTALSDTDTSLQIMMKLMQSQSVSAALSVTDNYIAPAQNLTLAGPDGIAMKTIGAIPMRNALHQTRGQLPSQGWVANNRWQGIFPQSENPTFINPPSDVLGNTNNKMVDRPFPNHLSFDWGDSQRILRWSKLVQNRDVHTLDSFIEIQQDSISPTARTLLPLIGANMWYEVTAATNGTLSAQRKAALGLLANWNGEMNEHMPEPLIYSAWIKHFQKRVIQDELGPLAGYISHAEPIFLEKVLRDLDGASIWCDVAQSDEVETCEQMANVALDDALIWLAQNYTGPLTRLRWGDAHTAVHSHTGLGRTPIFNIFTNIEQSTSGGDHTLMRGLTAGTGPNPFQNLHGATYRGVYDFADPDSSVFITSTGQSGHPLSPYYDDFGQLWRRGEYIPMTLDTDLARAGAIGITRLTPQLAE